MAEKMYVNFEMTDDLVDKAYEAVELARDTGEVRKGTNEVTKVVERGDADLVVMAEDVKPPEILAHLPLLCEEREVPFAYVPTQQELGAAAGLNTSSASVAVTDPGKGEQMIDDLKESLEDLK